MTVKNPVRIDKFLWAVRLFKTRSLATSACRMGRVLINNNGVKPSRIIEGNEMLTVRKPPVTYIYRVKEPIENRVSAKLVATYLEDLTPDTEKIKIEINRSGPVGNRKKGTGRPTKKERRIIDRWQDDFDVI
jgi:ribosome-associated heat shock protein Hsp15